MGSWCLWKGLEKLYKMGCPRVDYEENLKVIIIVWSSWRCFLRACFGTNHLLYYMCAHFKKSKPLVEKKSMGGATSGLL